MNPYSIQAPEEIAKQYLGDVPRILADAQSGKLDPTSALMATMFINQIRAGTQTGNPNPPTVAQQEYSKAGALPPMPQGLPQVAPQQMPPAGGLGATAPAVGGDMMATPQPAMEAAPEEPMGMSEGGLTTLPVPDTIFDEPDEGGYAGGGIVAFAQGDSINLEALRKALLEQESGGDYGAINAEGSGAMGGYQFLPDTARALAARLKMKYRPDLMSGEGGRSAEGRAYQERLMSEQLKDIAKFSGGDPRAAAAYHFAGPNRKGWGKKTDKYISDVLGRMGGASKQDGEEYYGIPTSDPRAAIQLAQELTPQDNTERAAYMEEIRKRMSPEEQKKERSRDLWAALSQFGANLASTPGGFLQAAASSAGQVLPGIMEAERQRKKDMRDASKELAAIENLSNEEKRALSKMGIDLYGAGVEGLEKRAAAKASQANQLEYARIISGGKGAGSTTPVGDTPKGRVALTKDLQKITDKIEKQYAPQLEMARSSNNPTQVKMLENRKLAEIQQQEDELHAAYGVEPPARKPVNVPINGKTYTFPNMYSALEAIRAYNASNR